MLVVGRIALSPINHVFLGDLAMSLGETLALLSLCSGYRPHTTTTEETMKATTPEGLLSIDDLARLLGVSRSTAKGLIARAEISTITIGSRRLITPRAYHDYVENRERAAEARDEV